MSVYELIVKLQALQAKGCGSYLVGCEANDWKNPEEGTFFQEYSKVIKCKEEEDGEIILIF